MPVFTVTAVDTGADTLAAVGHGLLTGDRFRLRNLGGALPAATPALAGVTDYFAIRVDADKIKVAVSSGDAFVPTPVNLTGAGSGTTKIEYGLPYCIPRIAVQGSQIKSADDNSNWNSLVALHDLLTGQPQTIWSAPGFETITHLVSGVTATETTVGSHLRTGDGWRINLAADPIVLSFVAPFGLRLVSWAWFLDKQSSAAATLTAKLFRCDTAGNFTQIGANQTNSAGAGPITLGQTVNHLIVADNTYRLEVTTNGAGGNLAVDFTRGGKFIFDRGQA